jgi:hypothetical protein
MKKSLKIFGLFLVAALLFSFAPPEKKLNKLIAKIWKDQPVEVTLVDLPDSMKTVVNSLYRISADGEILGYGCYTTAYGCRVGGCAAPGSPNESYETFDYMVVYDPNLSIIQVDIAEYGGQYGYEICRAKWLAQFAGRNDGFKLNENIDGVTGATISATFLVDDLNAVGAALKQFLGTNIP